MRCKRIIAYPAVNPSKALKMESHGRCPRCGYVLRSNRLNYACDFCGLQGSIPVSDMLLSIEKSLKGKVENFLQTLRNIGDAQQYWSMPPQSCTFCGFIFPSGNQPCPRCGRTPERITPFEQRVLDYISAHDGTISLSQAAQDLSISSTLLSQAIERLKATGRLKQTEL